MDLIRDGGVEGYRLGDIEADLDPERYRAFLRWFAGQTGAIVHGWMVVYREDYERFLAGRGDAEWEGDGANHDRGAVCHA